MIKNPNFIKSCFRFFLIIFFCGIPYIATADSNADKKIAILLTKNLAELGNYVVFSNKREEFLHDIPASVSVLTGDLVEETQISTRIEISHLDPSLTFQEGQNLSSSIISIRGIGSFSNSIGIEPSVVIMTDGEVAPRSSFIFQDLVDVERVEILKGPQGVLFGKNTSAGALHIITKKPNPDETEYMASFAPAMDDEYNFKGSATGPINSKLAYRAFSWVNHSGGFVENIRPENDDGGENLSFGTRGQLLMTPNNDLDILFRVDASRKESKGPAFVFDTPPIGTPGVIFTTGQAPTDGETTAQTDKAFYDTYNLGVSLETNWRFGEHTLTHLGTFRFFHQDTDRENSFSLIDTGPVTLRREDDMLNTQQEVRLASPIGGFSDYVVGVFYQYLFIDRTETERKCRLSDLDDGATVIDPVTLQVTDCAGSGEQIGQRADSTRTFANQNISAFGRLNLHPTEKLTLIGGARFIYERQDVEFDRFNTFDLTSGSANFRGGPFSFKGDTDDTAVIWNMGFKYDWADDLMSYFTYSTGYKGQSWFLAASAKETELTNGPAEAERVEQFEVGLKSQWFDNRLTLSLNGFYSFYRNFQQRLQEGNSGSVQLLGIEEVTSRGVEFNFEAQPQSNLQVTGALVYTDAYYSDASDTTASCPTGFTAGVAPCDSGPGNNRLDLTGSPLSNSPKWAGNINVRYDLPWLNQYDAYLMGKFRAKSRQQFGVTIDPVNQQNGYGIFDMHLGGKFKNGQYQANLFVMNLFNTHYATNISNQGSGRGAFRNVSRDFARYAGMSLTSSW